MLDVHDLLLPEFQLHVELELSNMHVSRLEFNDPVSEMADSVSRTINRQLSQSHVLHTSVLFRRYDQSSMPDTNLQALSDSIAIGRG